MIVISGSIFAILLIFFIHHSLHVLLSSAPLLSFSSI